MRNEEIAKRREYFQSISEKMSKYDIDMQKGSYEEKVANYSLKDDATKNFAQHIKSDPSYFAIKRKQIKEVKYGSNPYPEYTAEFLKTYLNINKISESEIQAMNARAYVDFLFSF
jgi:uncharacterized membrane protein